MNSTQLVAAALLDLCLPEDPVVLAILALASVRASLFLERAAAFCFNLSGLSEQDFRMETASSSNFLHLENASLHILVAFLILSCSSVLEHPTTASLAAVIPFQQVQASAEVDSLLNFLHFSASVSKVLVALSHFSIRVAFGLGKSSMLQEALMVIWHISRVSVRFFSWAAPEEFEDPAHVSADLFPPPADTNWLRTGPNNPFLPFFLSATAFWPLILADCF